MSALDLILPRLERVKRSGNGYTARCPAHDDKTASLSLTAAEDGRVLVHCFAGCPVHDVVGAIGLTVSDLFPPRVTGDRPEDRRRLRELARQGQWAAALGVLGREALVVLIACRMAAKGQPLQPNDLDRLAVAELRIDRCREVLRGN